MAKEPTITPTKAQQSKSNISNDLKADAMREIGELNREKDTAVTRIRNARKRYGDMGVDLKAVDFALRATNQDGEDFVRQLRSNIAYANIKGVGITSGGLFDMVDVSLSPKRAEEQANWAAREAGRKAALANGHRVNDNEFAPGTEAHAAFDAGFLQGAKELAAKSKGTGPKVASTRRNKAPNGESIN